MANTKISELPHYDNNATDLDDFFPVVQDGETKQLTLGDILRGAHIYTGALSNPPTRADFDTILGGTPPFNADFVVQSTSGMQPVFIVVYNHTTDTYWFERMTKAL